MIDKLKSLSKRYKLINNLLFPIIYFRRSLRNREKKYYEQLISNVVKGSLIVSVKNIPGQFEMDIRSDILKRILLSKTYEQKIVTLIKKYTSVKRDAINVGANVGLYTNLLANICRYDRKVLSIEPTPLAFRYLEKNIKLNNNISSTFLIKGVVTDKKENYVLNTVEGKEEYSSLGSMVHDSITEYKSHKINVEGFTIDYLVSKYKIEPGIIVIDVEGAENKVLKGAVNTIKKYRPVIITEINQRMLSEQGSSSADIFSYLVNLGYEIYNEDEEVIDHKSIGNILAKYKM